MEYTPATARRLVDCSSGVGNLGFVGCLFMREDQEESVLGSISFPMGGCSHGCLPEQSRRTESRSPDGPNPGIVFVHEGFGPVFITFKDYCPNVF